MLIITDAFDGSDTVVTVTPSRWPGWEKHPNLVTVQIFDYAEYSRFTDDNERTPKVLLNIDRDNLGALVALLQRGLSEMPDIEKAVTR